MSIVAKFEIGLKLYSSNTDEISEIIGIYEDNWFDYIELYVLPGTYEETIKLWSAVKIPYVIHAAHYIHGINFADAGWRIQNKINFTGARKFADRLKSDIIIVHAGNGGTIEEAIFQINSLNEPRIAIENKPKIGLNGKECIGWSALEFKLFRKAGILGKMVLDFSHAACASVSAGQNLVEWIKGFLQFKPTMFHLVDCDCTSQRDRHLNLGKGNLPIPLLMKMLDDNSRITLETPRDKVHGMADFKKDVKYVRNCINIT